jgi:uncharacterized iron-regulated membrane protein
VSQIDTRTRSLWKLWLNHPERSRVRTLLFQVHVWIGAVAGAYIFVMSVSGSLIVFRNELYPTVSVEWLVNLHTNLLAGSMGRRINGIGAIGLALLCLTGAVIWWPGIRHWRRSLTVDWSARFPRLNWDLHSAIGFWFFGFVAVWALSGIYFAFPRPFDALLALDPADRFTDEGLLLLSQLHFGRFGWLTEALWALVGLVPAVLAFTGVFICCRRVMFKKPSNPNAQPTGLQVHPLPAATGSRPGTDIDTSRPENAHARHSGVRDRLVRGDLHRSRVSDELTNFIRLPQHRTGSAGR